MEKSEFDEFVLLLTNAHKFWRQDITEFAISVWWQAMQPYSLDAVRRALNEHARDPRGGAFMPKPADLVKVLEGTHEDRAALAWSKVQAAMAMVGGYSSVVFDDAAIHCAVNDIGGWPAICAGEVTDLPFLQRRFSAAYLAHAKARTPHAGILVGRNDAQRLLAGHKPQPPQLVGDPDKARAVLALGSSESAKTLTFTTAAEAVKRMEAGNAQGH